MYMAPLFINQNSADIFEVVKNFSFGTLISKDLNDEIYISHIPILPQIEGDRLQVKELIDRQP